MADDAPGIDFLAPETLSRICAFLSPLEVKRFGATCRRHQKVAAEYGTSVEYGRLLAREMCDAVAAHLVNDHESCPAPKLREFAARFAAKLEAYLARWSYAETPWSFADPAPPPASKTELLRVLYPLAVYLARAPWAPYAFEWCARVDGARPELLALLHKDAVARIADLVRASHWEEGQWMINTVSGALRTSNPTLLESVKGIIGVIGAVLADSAKRRNDVIILLALDVALRNLLRSRRDDKTPRPGDLAWSGMRRLEPAVFFGTGNQELDQWIDLLGLMGDSRRNPINFMSHFNHDSEEDENERLKKYTAVPDRHQHQHTLVEFLQRMSQLAPPNQS
jgi:hypothetical protein